MSTDKLKDRMKKGLPVAAAFAVGVVGTALVIRYRNGIGLNEVIWVIPADKLRELAAPGSHKIMNTPKGEMFVTKMSRGGAIH